MRLCSQVPLSQRLVLNILCLESSNHFVSLSHSRSRSRSRSISISLLSLHVPSLCLSLTVFPCCRVVGFYSVVWAGARRLVHSLHACFACSEVLYFWNASICNVCLFVCLFMLSRVAVTLSLLARFEVCVEYIHPYLIYIYYIYYIYIYILSISVSLGGWGPCRLVPKCVYIVVCLSVFLSIRG